MPRWQDIVRELGQAPDALPAEVDLTMQDLVSLFEKSEKIKDLDQRIQGIDRDTEGLVNETSRLVASVSPEYTGLPVEEMIAALKKALDKSVERDTRRLQIEAQIIDQTERRSEAENTVSGLDRTLQRLCKDHSRNQMKNLNL